MLTEVENKKVRTRRTRGLTKGTRHLTINVPEPLYDRLDAYARENGDELSLAGASRIALDKGLKSVGH